MDKNLYNEIYARLENGESVDAIAKDITDQLNKASKAHSAELDAKKNAEKLQKEKEKRISTMFADFMDFMTTYYPKWKIEAPSADTIAQIVRILDNWYKLTDNVDVKIDLNDTVRQLDKPVERPSLNLYNDLIKSLREFHNMFDGI